MSFSQAKPLLIGRGPNSTPVFSGGVVDSLMPNDIEDGQSTRIVNARLEGQYTVPRKGREILFYTDFPAIMCHSCHLLGKTYVAFQRELQNNLLLFDITQSYTAQAPLTTLPGFLTSGNKWGMFEGVYSPNASIISYDSPLKFRAQPTGMQKCLFVLDGVTATNVVYDNGTTIVQGSSSTIFTQCTMGTWFDSRAWYSGRKGFENVLYISLANAGNYYPPDGEPKIADSYTLTFPNPIKGLLKTENSLFVFMENQIAVIDAGGQSVVDNTVAYASRYIHAKEGIGQNHYAYAVGNAVYYFSKSGKICRVTRGSSADGHFEVQEISHHPTRGIKGYMQGIKNVQGVNYPYFFVYDSKNNLLKFHCQRNHSGALNVTSENDTVIIYDLSRECFLIDEIYTGSGVATTHGLQAGGDIYLVGNQNRTFMKDESEYWGDGWNYGPPGNTVYPGQDIIFQRRSKLFDMGDWSRKKELWQVRTVYQGNPGVDIQQSIFMHDVVQKSKVVNLTASKIVPGGGMNLPSINGASVLLQTPAYMPTYYSVIEKSNLGLRGYAMEALWESRINTPNKLFRLQSFDMTCEALDEKVSAPS